MRKSIKVLVIVLLVLTLALQVTALAALASFLDQTRGAPRQVQAMERDAFTTTTAWRR